MSTKFIGRLFNVGFGKEASRGAPITTNAYWEPTKTISFDEEADQVTQDQSYGGIEDAQDQHNTAQKSKGSIESLIHDQSIGALMLYTFGTETGLATVESGVDDHTFTVLESAQHPTMTVSIQEPNDTGGTGNKLGRSFPLGLLDKMELNVKVGDFATYRADFTANYGQGSQTTVGYAYVTQNVFLPQYGSLITASTYGGLGTGTTVANVKSIQVSFSKNTEEDITIGNLNPVDRLNKQFAIEGMIEITYTDRTWIDTYLLADAAIAMRIKLVNTDVTIGATSHPTITLDLARVKMKSVSRKIGINNITTETLKIKAYYSVSDTTIGQVVVRNTVVTRY